MGTGQDGVGTGRCEDRKVWGQEGVGTGRCGDRTV